MQFISRLIWLWMPLFLLYPLWAAGTEFVLGFSDSDVYKHVWGHWWVRHMLFSRAELPFHQDLLFFPGGGSFFCLDTLHAILLAPIAWIGLVPSYNIGILLQLMLFAVGVQKLSESIGIAQSRTWFPVGLSLLSSWVFAFPIASGVSEHMGYCLSPWIIFFLDRCFKSNSNQNVILFSLLWLLQSFLCWSFSIMTGLIVIMGLGFWLCQRPWQEGTEPWRFSNGVLKRAALATVLLMGPIVLLYVLVYSISTGSDAVYQRSLSIFPNHLPWNNPQSNGFALSELLSPLKRGLRTVNTGVETLRYAGYPGVVLMGIALWAGWKGDFKIRFCLASALSFAALSLGPVVRLLPTDIGGINLWYSLWYGIVPLFNVLEHNVDRFILPAYLFLVMGAAAFAQRLSHRYQLGLGVICLIEWLLLSPSPWPSPLAPAREHPISVRIAESGGGAVIDIPYTIPQSTQVIGDIFFQQSIHQQPIPYRLEGVGPNMVYPTVRDNPFFERIHNLSQQQGTSQDAVCAGTQELATLGFRYIVLRQDSLTESRQLEYTLSQCLELVLSAENRQLYQFSVP